MFSKYSAENIYFLKPIYQNHEILEHFLLHHGIFVIVSSIIDLFVHTIITLSSSSGSSLKDRKMNHMMN